ncbi:MAG: GNAT family N-acetyltransferase [Acidimicrobiales bacterium]|nr:GNAT family N-acetyltransferase [Acidimicrobiales bacterium]
MTTAPAHWTCDVVAADGGIVHLRPVASIDAAALMELHAGLSADSQYLRYFRAKPRLPVESAEELAGVDHVDEVVLLAEVQGHVVGMANYVRGARLDEAEVAFVVADEYHGRGIGTLLLEHLAAAARERGITRFVADTLAHNQRMRHVFRSAGFAERAEFDGEVVHVELHIEPTEQSRASVEAREHRSEAASIRTILSPRSVAVIGASRNPTSVGHQVLVNLLAGGFDGTVHPVHPEAVHVASVKAYPTVVDVPDDVDLAVVAVPAPAVTQVVEQCAAKGVNGLVVLTAGFGELGADGSDAQAALRRLVRHHGMRLVGPNCIGLANTAVGLNATFVGQPPRAGRCAVVTQSGAIGIELLDDTARRDLGISSFVSVGNKADVSGNDLLQYWEDDPDTDVILLYLESFGNPRKFARIARRVARRKPIIAVKSGRTTAGSRAASSHTAALASPDAAVDALFSQTGVIRTDTVDEMLDVAALLSSQPIPQGRSVAIVGNSGGPGILAADACSAADREVAELTEDTQARLRAFVDPNASVSNPVDLVASADVATYERALRVLLDDAGVDTILVVCTPTFAVRPRAVAELIPGLDAGDTTVVACFIAWSERPALAGTEPGRAVPTFASPEPAARALGRAAVHGEWRRRSPGVLPVLEGFDADQASDIVAHALADRGEGGWLDPATTHELLAAAGVGLVRSTPVEGPDHAATAAIELGFPVVLKAAGPDLVHKSDVGGVRLALGSAAEVRSAYDEMTRRIGAAMTGAVVQPMVPEGVETIIGVVQDDLFGPLVLFGLGGVATELLGDRALRILPLTDLDARAMVTSLRSSPLLFGYRGASPVATDALEDTLQRVARLAATVPEVAELDLNPVIASERGVTAVDARVRLRPARPGTDPDRRHMS